MPKRFKRGLAAQMATSHLDAVQFTRAVQAGRLARGEIPLTLPNIRSTVWAENPGPGKKRTFSFEDYSVTVFGGVKSVTIVEKKKGRIVKRWRVQEGNIVEG